MDSKEINQEDIKSTEKEDEDIKKTDDKEDTKDNEISLEDKIKNLEDKLARTLAEMENQRRRFEKEKDDAFEYGGFTFAKEALNLLDNLERAKISLENDEELKKSSLNKKIIESLDIIYKDTLSIFKKNNIEQIDTNNKKMDPNLHQAMMEVEDETKEQGTIVQEIQKGYKMKDRLLRPSLVGVSKKRDLDKKSEMIEKNEENKEKNA
tara:strand:- start:591 stop:1214 length:624 start_codon:yes stop_codon:yes gene_type:complete